MDEVKACLDKLLKISITFLIRMLFHKYLDELEKDLIELKYNTISDASDELGSPQIIRDTFVGFQRFLYGTQLLPLPLSSY